MSLITFLVVVGVDIAKATFDAARLTNHSTATRNLTTPPKASSSSLTG